MSDKTKQLIKNIIVAVLSAILTWLGVSCTNMLSIQKNVKGSSMNTDNKTDGKVSADSTSINLFNNEEKEKKKDQKDRREKYLGEDKNTNHLAKIQYKAKEEQVQTQKINLVELQTKNKKGESQTYPTANYQ